MVIIRKQLMPDPIEGGGGQPGGGQPGGGEGTPTLTPEQQQAEIDELTQLLDKTDLDEKGKTRLTELQGKYAVEFVDADGNPLTPEKKAELEGVKKKLDAIIAKPQDQWSEEDKKFVDKYKEPEVFDPKKIYEAVDTLKGFKLDVDYEGIDPVSPEGIAKRETILYTAAQEDYEQQLQEKYPRAYQFITHLANGGKEEDFFKENNRDWKSIKIEKENKGQHENILRSALRIKGNTPDQIEALVKYYKDSGTLYEAAQNELQANIELQTAREQQAEIRRAQVKQQEQKDINSLASAVGTALDKGFEGIQLSPQERDEFRNFLGNRIEYLNGQFLIIRPIDTKELTKELKYEYFQYKKGNIDDLATRKAKTLNAIKVKGLIKPQITPKSGAGAGSKKLTAKDI